MAVYKIKKILVTRLRFMGDIILTTPLLSALRENYPSAKITYVAEKPYSCLLEHHPLVDEVWTLNRKNTLQSMQLCVKLLLKNFDLAIDLFGNPRSALITLLSGAKVRIGGDFRGRRHLYTHTINNRNKILDAVQFHLSYLEPLNLDYQIIDPFIVITDEEKRTAQEYLHRKGYRLEDKIVGIHVGATWPAKRWFPNRFAVLANRLVSQNNCQILFTLGPGEQEILKNVIKSCNFSIVEPNVLPVRQLAAVLSLLNVFVSNDCGPMHLAPAVGTKTIGLFGPGEPEIWFPYKSYLGHRFIHHELKCSRCHKDFCDSMICMQSITVNEVYEAVVSTLKATGKTNV
jgi:ADP-heptose:LPS heptosyltransferase